MKRLLEAVDVTHDVILSVLELVQNFIDSFVHMREDASIVKVYAPLVLLLQRLYSFLDVFKGALGLSFVKCDTFVHHLDSLRLVLKYVLHLVEDRCSGA